MSVDNRLEGTLPVDFTVNAEFGRSFPRGIPFEGDEERFSCTIQICAGFLDEKSRSMTQAEIAKITSHQVFGKEPPADPFKLTGIQTLHLSLRNLPDTCQ
jgi:hypothetical protein